MQRREEENKDQKPVSNLKPGLANFPFWGSPYSELTDENKTPNPFPISFSHLKHQDKFQLFNLSYPSYIRSTVGFPAPINECNPLDLSETPPRDFTNLEHFGKSLHPISGLTRSGEERPRMRVCFDPEKEIPLLQKWFSFNNHPTRTQVLPGVYR